MIDMDSFSTLKERLHSGDDAAAREVFDRFAVRLVALARRQFNRRLVCRVDPEDLVQSAFKSFFLRQREGMLQPADWDELWSVLTLITVRKCVDRVGYLRAKKRDVFREAQAHEGQEMPWQFALDREPRPDEAAALAETVDNLLQATDSVDRPILELSLQGYTAAEIGLRLGRALRSVQRVREQVRKRLERESMEAMRVGA